MKSIKSISISTIIVILIIVCLTIGAELSSTVKNSLASFSGHHWTTKGIIALGSFLLLNLIFGRMFKKEVDVLSYTKKVIWATVIGIVAISSFYVWHYFAV